MDQTSHITVREVKTRREQLEFLRFPLDLYRGNPCFVPPLWGDEKKIFSKNYVYTRDGSCEAVYFNAYDGKKIVGRISGILQKASNEKRGEKRVRFNRFDAVNDPAVAAALFGAVEDWARARGMDTVCGPLGFSDLEREGLLIEGFDQLSTFEEQYNADYYQSLIENLGYEKEVDWNESKLRAPKEGGEDLKKLADFIMKRYDLHFGPAKSTNDFLRRYGDGFFEMIDKTYADIYGTVPFTDGMKKMMIDNFRLIIDLRHVAVILDRNDRIVCFGLCFPSIAEAVQKSDGHLTPAALVRLLRAIRHPRVIDLGLVGVDPEYANRGISTAISAALIEMLQEDGVEYAETNLNLEDNLPIQNQWRRFDREIHKRRRAFVKKLS